MTVLALIETARASGVSLAIEGDKLVIEADYEPPANLLIQLRQHKADLIRSLAGSEPGSAIVQHDPAGPRAWAQAVARLDPDRPPHDVPPHRWAQFVDDAHRFLSSGFPEQAVSLGWNAFDLFGCDRNRPFARIDQSGLVWLLNGDRLIALTANSGITETRRGVRLTFYRKPSSPERILAWEV